MAGLAEQRALLPVGQADVGELLAHAVVGDHPLGHVGRPVQVVGGAGGNLSEDHLLGPAPAEQHVDPPKDVALGEQEAVLGGGLHGVAERSQPARHDGDLAHRIGVRRVVGDQCVSRLVVGDDPLFLGIEHPAALLQPGDHLVDRLAEVALGDRLAARAHRQQRRLVDDVGQVGAGEAGRGARHLQQVDLRRQLHLRAVDLQDRLAARQVGLVHQHLPVEAPGPQQRGVQHLRPVGGAQDDHPGAGVEAVHLHQELVEGLLALVVAAGDGHAAALADGVQLVDEDDAGRLLARLLEQVAHARGAHAHEHLHEVGAVEAEEGDLGLACHRPRQQRLAGARRPDQQHALGDLAADLDVAIGILEEVDHLLQLGLGLVRAGDVREVHAGLSLGHHLGARLPERHHVGAHGAEPFEHEAPHHEHQSQRDHPLQDQPEQRAVAARGGVVLDALLVEQVDEPGIVDPHGAPLLDVRSTRGARSLQPPELRLGDAVADVLVLGDAHALDLPVVHEGLERAVFDHRGVLLTGEQRVEQQQRGGGDDDVPHGEAELVAARRLEEGRLLLRTAVGLRGLPKPPLAVAGRRRATAFVWVGHGCASILKVVTPRIGGPGN